MILGGLPRLKLDRTGVALLGAIAIVGLGDLTPEAAARAIHLPTILLLFAFMVISAQMRLGGFYAAVTRRIVALPVSPAALLAWIVGAAAALSAVFSNDIVCLAMAPVLAQACIARRLDPVPYLLALACAANIGSAATLIGNPQNMLIGEVLGLSFGGYLRDAMVPVLLGLAALWLLLRPTLRALDAPVPVATAGRDPPFDAWQSGKGLAVAVALLVVFLATDWPRDVAALVGAGLLLLSARFHTRQVTALIDWDLLVLFMSLFVVNHALAHTGVTAQAVAALRTQGLDLEATGPLFGATLALSNLVSNVPAVMLLLPMAGGAADPAGVGLVLALVSTLAGNLLIVGSIANIIVVDAARREGIAIDWKRHARAGVPVTLATLTIAAAWLAWRA
ncbi:MAG: anion transporter [Rhodoferax sp.]|nr:anion transporter [Rhodoferax sp.]MCL4737337.1 anion transporter [Burkholderiaceae bacterium]MCP5288899.1 anion transporter [Burkholderiaceae bacterium]